MVRKKKEGDGTSKVGWYVRNTLSITHVKIRIIERGIVNQPF